MPHFLCLALQPREIIGRDAPHPPLVPCIDRHHEMAREGSGEFRRLPGFEPLVVKRRDFGHQAGFGNAQTAGAHHRAENQPIRRHIFGRVRRHAKPGAANQRAIETKRIRVAEGDRLFRRRQHGERVGQGVHAGIEDLAREPKWLFRLQHKREFDQLEATDIEKRAGAAMRLAARRGGRDRLRKRVLALAQLHGRDQWREVNSSVQGLDPIRAAENARPCFCMGNVI